LLITPYSAIFPSMKRETALVVLSYALVYIVWGSTYFFIKAAVMTIPAPFVVAWRFLMGACILSLLAALKGGFTPFPRPKEIIGSMVLGILLLLLGNGLMTEAQRTIPSWMGSIITSCMPIYVAFYNLILFRTHISKLRLVGAFSGVLGVMLVIYDGTTLSASFNIGILIAILGALAWGFGTSFAKALPKAKNVFASTAIQMTTAAAFAFAIGILQGGHPLGSLAAASPWSLFSLVYLGSLGALALVAYNHLLVVEPSFRVSSYSLVNPVIAVSIGLAAGERAAPYLAWGLLPVMGGLTLILYGDAILAKMTHGVKLRKGSL